MQWVKKGLIFTLNEKASWYYNSDKRIVVLFILNGINKFRRVV
jgi:hypothetical protein